MGTSRVSLGCPRIVTAEGVVPWENIETMNQPPPLFPDGKTEAQRVW